MYGGERDRYERSGGWVGRMAVGRRRGGGGAEGEGTKEGRRGRGGGRRMGRRREGEVERGRRQGRGGGSEEEGEGGKREGGGWKEGGRWRGRGREVEVERVPDLGAHTEVLFVGVARARSGPVLDVDLEAHAVEVAHHLRHHSHSPLARRRLAGHTDGEFGFGQLCDLRVLLLQGLDGLGQWRWCRLLTQLRSFFLRERKEKKRKEKKRKEKKRKEKKDRGRKEKEKEKEKEKKEEKRRRKKKEEQKKKYIESKKELVHSVKKTCHATHPPTIDNRTKKQINTVNK